MNNISKVNNFSELIEKIVNSKNWEKEFEKIKSLNDLYKLFKSKNYKGDYNCWIKELNSSFKEFSGKINLSDEELDLLAAGKNNSMLKYSAALLASPQVLAPMTSTYAMNTNNINKSHFSTLKKESKNSKSSNFKFWAKALATTAVGVAILAVILKNLSKKSDQPSQFLEQLNQSRLPTQSYSPSLSSLSSNSSSPSSSLSFSSAFYSADDNLSGSFSPLQQQHLKIIKGRINFDVRGSASKEVIKVFSCYKNLKSILSKLNKLESSDKLPTSYDCALKRISDNKEKCDEFIRAYENIVGEELNDTIVNPYLYDMICKHALYENMMRRSGGTWSLLDQANELLKNGELYDAEVEAYPSEVINGFQRAGKVVNNREVDICIPSSNFGDVIIQEGLIFKICARENSLIQNACTFSYTIPDPKNEESILFSAAMEEWMRNYHNYCIDNSKEIKEEAEKAKEEAEKAKAEAEKAKAEAEKAEAEAEKAEAEAEKAKAEAEAKAKATIAEAKATIAAAKVKVKENEFNKETEIYNYLDLSNPKDSFYNSAHGLVVGIPSILKETFKEAASKNKLEGVAFKLDTSQNHMYGKDKYIISIYLNEAVKKVQALIKETQ